MGSFAFVCTLLVIRQDNDRGAVSVPYIVGNDKDGLPPALLRANNGVIEMAEHYGATFIPRISEDNLLKKSLLLRGTLIP